jgi:hypothetical protein
VTEGLGEHVLPALARGVASTEDGLTQPDHPDDGRHGPGEQGHAHDRHDQGEDYRGDLHGHSIDGRHCLVTV